MRIRTKLFVIFVLLTLTTVAVMLGFTRWSLEHGFVAFVERRQMQRVARVMDNLIARYEQDGGWSAMRADPSLWLRALGRGKQLARMLNQSDGDRSARRARRRWLREALASDSSEWPPRVLTARFIREKRPFTLEMRIMLLDAKHKPVWARPDLLANAHRRPLKDAAGEAIIGYLALLPGATLSELGELRFLQRQSLSTLLIALAAAIASGVAALVLARRLTQPLALIQSTARALARGDYAARARLTRSDELGMLARDVDALADQLQSNEGARRQWVADISHELRTPIGVMRAELEALQDGIRAATPASIDSLHADLLRLQRLVEDLYELSLTDLGAMSYRMEAVDLAAIVNDDLEAFGHELETAGIALRTEGTDGAPVMIYGDAGRLSQLFRNLLSNSIRYTDSPGLLLVGIHHQGSQVTVEFADSAPGVPDAALPRLFERLYRVEGSRTRIQGGSGLGLAIAANIATAHGARFTASTSPLGGLSVSILFTTL